MTDKAITCLQLGVSRLEVLKPNALKVFLDKKWLHFGNPTLNLPMVSLKRDPVNYLKTVFRNHSLLHIAKRLVQILFLGDERIRMTEEEIRELYSKTNFQDFHFQKGDRLPFDDNSLDFIFSEHFFEHLFLDEAQALYHEAFRVLRVGGVIRTSVPDADLRTYEKPEMIGFPDIATPHDHPDKHKTRWSVYSLQEVIGNAGFYLIPLRYCTKTGEYVKVNPEDRKGEYKDSPEQELCLRLNYLIRPDSLIIDGIKKLRD